MAQLQHANIVQVYEVGEHNGQPFFALELVEGGTLAEKLAGRGGLIEWGELALVEDTGLRQIGMSFYARWAA